MNLIVGQNGSGKTSLLELIEALYCGRVRRDPAANFSGIRAEVRMPDNQLLEVKGTKATAIIKARNLAWYGRPDYQARMICKSFTQFNFLDTDAAFRLSSETNPEGIKEDLNSLLVGPETSRPFGTISLNFMRTYLPVFDLWMNASLPLRQANRTARS